jgi:flagella basal body P-ring formation protein FlgA
VVTLGDVAEILAADARTAGELAAIELFPAPSTDRQRFVRVRQIQDALYLRGVDLAEHRFSGSSQIVLGTEAPEPEVVEPRPLSTVLVERARRYVAQAVLEYLRRQVPDTSCWKVDVQLDEEQARQLTAAGSSISVQGGTAPWLGPQRFQISIVGATEPVAFEIDATVSMPTAVVVAARPLPRGVLISAADVRLEPLEPTAGIGQPFNSIDQVVGRETAEPISAGKPLEADSLRLPLLVRRGDVVTVFARAAGIRVRTTARARDEGSLGDLVAVESILDRRRYFARVAGLREVEIFAQAVQTESSAEAKKSSSRRSNVTESLGGVW